MQIIKFRNDLAHRGAVSAISTHRRPLAGLLALLTLALWPMSNAMALSDMPASLCWPAPVPGETAAPMPAYCTDGSYPQIQQAWKPIRFNGQPIHDYEQIDGTDPTTGGTSFGNDDQDLSSGYLPGGTPTPNDNCHPDVNGDSNCGPEPSGYWMCAEVPDDAGSGAEGTPRTRAYLRMRVQADPRTQPGGSTASKPDLTSRHWNHLFSTTVDSPSDFKEFWIDMDGSFNSQKPDWIRIIFQDNNSNSVTNDNAANCTGVNCGPAATVPGNGTGTHMNSFVACGAQGLTGTGCRLGNIELSHARVLTATCAAGAGVTCEEEFWVDIQVPLTEPAAAPVSACGADPCYVLNENTTSNYTIGIGGGGVANSGQWASSGADSTPFRGVPIITTCNPDDGPAPTPIAFVYSTSASNINPIQKDFILAGVSDFTLASIAYFRATPTGTGVRFDWQTSAELANLGFDIYAKMGQGWYKINSNLIPGAVDSFVPKDYSYEAQIGGATQFFLVDTDINMRKQRHGPYKIDTTYGARLDPEPINWAGIQSESDNKKKARTEKRQDALKKHLGQKKNGGNLTTLSANNQASAASAGSQALLDLGVEQDGIHRVTYAQLLAAGVDLAGVPSNEIALTHRGNPVPIHVDPTGNRKFNAGGYIEFVGEAPQSLYSATNVYQLHVDKNLALRVDEDNTKPKNNVATETEYLETVTVDDNVSYAFTSPADDPWFKTTLIAWGGSTSVNLPIELDNVVAGTAATLNLDVWGVGDFPADPDHHLIVKFNNTQVADEHFDGNVDVPLSIALPAGLVQEGGNTLTLQLPFDHSDPEIWIEQLRVNSYGVSYQRSLAARDGALAFNAAGNAFEVAGVGSGEVIAYRSNGTNTTLINGTKVQGGTATVPGNDQAQQYFVANLASVATPSLAPSALNDDITSGDAAYLVISHPDFLSGPARADLDRLVNAREAQYGSAKVVDVEQIYAQYAGGNIDPNAIRQYVQDAVANQGTQAVLLVGGDTYDYLNYLGLDSVSFIPSLYADVGDGFKYTPADPLYVDTDGDNIPDADIGRLPVRDDAELKTMVDKTLAFAAAGNSKAVFAADDTDAQYNYTDLSEAIAAETPASWDTQRIYLDTYIADGSGAQAAHNDLITALNQGDAALVSYVGHSGPGQWTINSPALLTASDAASLNSSGASSVIAQWGCWMDYLNPNYNTLTHKLLLNPTGGATATYGMSGANSVSSDTELAPKAQQAMMQSGTTIGGAFTSAKQQIAPNAANLLDVIVGGTLLGDPGIKVNP